MVASTVQSSLSTFYPGSPPRHHDEADAPGIHGVRCAPLVEEEETEDSGDPQHVKVISHRGRIRPHAASAEPTKPKQHCEV